MTLDDARLIAAALSQTVHPVQSLVLEVRAHLPMLVNRLTNEQLTLKGPGRDPVSMMANAMMMLVANAIGMHDR